MNVEGTRIPFPCRPAESIYGRTDLDVPKPGFLKHPFPACARQASGDSTRPEINVAHNILGNRLAIGDVGELYSPTGPEHAPDFRKYPPLVGA